MYDSLDKSHTSLVIVVYIALWFPADINIALWLPLDNHIVLWLPADIPQFFASQLSRRNRQQAAADVTM